MDKTIILNYEEIIEFEILLDEKRYSLIEDIKNPVYSEIKEELQRRLDLLDKIKEKIKK